MRWRLWLFAVCLLPAPVLPAVVGQGTPAQGAKFKITWKKTVVDRAFRSEGVAVADVNKDGKLDVIAGDVWYEAPDWKMHVIRADRKFNPAGYSQSFGCFAEDLNGDGWTDVIVIPWPGDPVCWYENPKGKPGPWKEHVIWHSCCNETPQYVDLFSTGKRVLIMGTQPLERLVRGADGRFQLQTKGNQGQMAWFRPGKDPTQLWEMHPISEPSQPGKEIPGTQRFSHGLGVGDINGDGRADVLCPGGWWEQPAKDDGKPWTFHPANLGDACADMFAYDIDGDGRADVISSSAHRYGLWWHQQRGDAKAPTFVRQDLSPMPNAWAVPGKEVQLSKDEQGLYAQLNKHRQDLHLAPMRADAARCEVARRCARDKNVELKQVEERAGKSGYKGQVFVAARNVGDGTPAAVLKELLTKTPEAFNRWTEVGVGCGENDLGEKWCVLIFGKGDRFYLMSETHALHCVDIDGDGLKDLVTGRRWWSHGARGEPGSGDPAFLYWFKAQRKNGIVTFTPILIDDDSGIGTQFAVTDINGDGLLDIIISNKKGVFIIEQVRTKEE